MSAAHISNFKFKDLHKYAKNFELQKALDRKKCDREIYVDASDAISMLRGIYSVHNEYRFSDEKFRRGVTLVYAMIYKGWFGSVKLLTPHSKEFVTKLKINAALFPQKMEPDELKKLGHELLNRVELDKLIQKKENPRKKDIETHYKDYKHKAEDLFKAVYLGKDLFWKNRYIHLFKKEKPIIELSNNNYSENRIYKTSLYDKLFKIFNRERSTRKKNNHEDAIALCILNEKLQRYNLNPTEYPLPLFYSHSYHILKGVQECAKEGLKEGVNYFTFQIDNKSYCNVQDTDFFLIDGVFDLENKSDSFFEEFVETLADVPSTKILTIALEDEETKRIHENKNKRTFLEFFKHWIQESGYGEIQDLLINVKNHDKQVDEKITGLVNNDINKLAKHFNVDIQKIRLINRLWYASGNIKKKLKEKYLDEEGKHIVRALDAYSEFTTRFSYPENFREKLDEYFSDLLHAIKDDESEHTDAALSYAISDTKSFIFESITKYATKSPAELVENKEKWESELYKITLMLSLLWISEQYELLCRCCDVICSTYRKIRDKTSDQQAKLGYPDYRIALLHACALIRSRKYDIGRIIGIFDCINEKKHWQKNYKMWLGMSFARYVLWESEADVKLPLELQHREYRNIGADHLKKSGDLALKTIAHLEELKYKQDLNFAQKLRYLYAVNNYVYAISVIGTQEEVNSLGGKIQLMEGARDNQQWLERYHDTLATYYTRKAIFEKDFSKKGSLGKALKHIKKAIDKVGASNLYTTLQDEIKNLQKGKKKYLALRET